jgi:hypothetical protein
MEFGCDLLEMELEPAVDVMAENRGEAHTVAAEELGCGNRGDVLHRSDVLH